MKHTNDRKPMSRAVLSMALLIGIMLFVSSCGAKTVPAPEALGGHEQDRQVQNISEPLDDDGYCHTPGCVHAAEVVLKNMDPSVEPCDNFYRFACGGFLKDTVIPDDETSVDSFSIVSDKLLQQLNASVQAEVKPNDTKQTKQIKHLYKLCMDTDTIESQGLQPLLKSLKKLGGWPVLDGDSWNDNDFDWKDSVYKFRDAGYNADHFIEFSVSVDLKNSTKHVIALDQAYIGFSRKYLLKGFGEKLILAHYNYMVDIAVILGADRSRAEKELREVVEFEMKLANISLPNEKRRNATQLYNPMTLAELTKNYPAIPWKEYFSRLLPPSIVVEENEVAIVNVPRYISDFEILMSQTPKRTQANYAMWRATATSVSYLTDDLRKRQLAYAKVLSGRNEREPRWKECVDMLAVSLPFGVGAMYVKEYFNEEAKKNASEMVADIMKQFTNILKTAEWMDDKTKKSALEKAAAMASHIAYPDELLDDEKVEKLYETLELSGDNYLESILNLSRHHTEYSFGKLREPLNKTDWVSYGRPAVINAFYSHIKNSIQFPAGILQGAFFSNDRPRYMNYGAIGTIIGHEITHGFGDIGRRFDKHGNLVDWWAPSTKEKYLERAECIIHQYGNYTVEEVGIKLNGINTQGENIADNGGMKEAYLAYKNWAAKNGPEKKLPGIDRSPAQMFWISAANMWCKKYRPEVLKASSTVGTHSPSEFRILGTLSNRPEFAKDFMCPEGSRMNPKKKCSVW